MGVSRTGYPRPLHLLLVENAMACRCLSSSEPGGRGTPPCRTPPARILRGFQAEPSKQKPQHWAALGLRINSAGYGGLRLLSRIKAATPQASVSTKAVPRL